ncbi:inositol-3-phosphate synthase [Phaffia rhodozyma]|uniref:Inositol-3-phosphate synthase n=1 Tax=Phaffia rhodozyma TaxID=264483 RepID=A0A0F7ST93_PHARH|nr:inositol-3-phosphate synthase [Phaffia rhodozyma]
MNSHPNGSDISDSASPPHSLPATPSQDAAYEIHPTAARTAFPKGIEVDLGKGATVYSDDEIRARFVDRKNEVVCEDGKIAVTRVETGYEFKTKRTVPKTGLMLIGLGGNNGTTLVASILANRHQITWGTKDGRQGPNYIGSLVRASTMRIGVNPVTGHDVNIPFSDVLPMVHPNDFVLGGWDISGMPLDKAMNRAKVLEYDLQRQVAPLMSEIKPLPSVYYPDFIAANQEERADNVLPGNDKQVHLDKIRQDIRDFKAEHDLETVVVFWTANTERYSDIIPGVNETSAEVLRSIQSSHSEVSPSSLFAVASILEGCPFVNGAPQNTFVPGIVRLAEENKAFIGGDDLKSGQTKVKSVLAEFLVNAGIKPLSVASYNHLGNNDGRNLSAPSQFRSKEISKSSVIDDMVASNALLYKTKEQLGEGAKKGEHPDHLVVIKYVPTVGDSKRAIDEYVSELFCGGRNTMNIFNQCEDSLLATPLILDLAILAELLTRVQYRVSPHAESPALANDAEEPFQPLHSVLSLLSYMLKAPVVKDGTAVINSLARQRNGLEQFLKACLGLDSSTDLLLESRIW